MTLTAAASRAGFLSVFLLLLLSSSAAWNSTSDGAGSDRTVAIIKPDGVSSDHAEEIKKIILASGFRILQEKTVQLDEKSAATFYSEHSNKKFFHSLVQYMTSGPVLVMVLEKENAIADWRTLIGPTDSSKAKITHPQSLVLEQCVGQMPRRIACMVQILIIQQDERYHFSLSQKLQKPEIVLCGTGGLMRGLGLPSMSGQCRT